MRLCIHLVGLNDGQRAVLSSVLDGSFYVSDEFDNLDGLKDVLDITTACCIIVNSSIFDRSPSKIIQKVRELSPWTQLIIITERPPVATVVEAMLSGFIDVLDEPISGDLLTKAIHRAKEESEKEKWVTLLSSRELEVLNLLVDGLPNKRVGNHLGISYRTVEVYRARIMDKLSVRSFAELVLMVSRSRRTRNLVSIHLG